jgi:hypothetical protein
MSFDEYGPVAPEDEALFDTRRYRKILDRDVLLFIGVLVVISMVAGFCGGLPLTFIAHRASASEYCRQAAQAGGNHTGNMVRLDTDGLRAKRAN